MLRSALSRMFSNTVATATAVAAPAVIAISLYFDMWTDWIVGSAARHGVQYAWGFREGLESIYTARLWVGGILAALALLALATMLVRLICGTPQDRSLRHLLSFVAVVAIWLSLALSYDDIGQAGFEYRVRRAFPKFQSMATALAADWPTESCELADGTEIRQWPDNADYLKVTAPNPSFSWDVRIDSCERLENGCIRIRVGEVYRGINIEFRPDGSRPKDWLAPSNSPAVSDKHFEVERVMEVKPHWFLVAYKWSWVDPSKALRLCRVFFNRASFRAASDSTG